MQAVPARQKKWALSQWARRPSCTVRHGCEDGHGNPYDSLPDQAIMGKQNRCQNRTLVLQRQGKPSTFLDLDRLHCICGVVGYKLRTERWAYTAWMSFDWGVGSDPKGEASVPDFSDISALELYDHEVRATVVAAAASPRYPADSRQRKLDD